MCVPRWGLNARSCSAASLGGWLAAEWAVRYPEMLRALILVDAFGLRVPEAPATDLLRLDPGQMRSVLFADPNVAVAQTLIPDVPAPESLEALLRARQTLARFAWQFPDNPKLSRYLYRVKTPTLIIWGAQDGVVSTAHAQAYLRGIAGAELVVLPALWAPAAGRAAGGVCACSTALSGTTGVVRGGGRAQERGSTSAVLPMQKREQLAEDVWRKIGSE